MCILTRLFYLVCIETAHVFDFDTPLRGLSEPARRTFFQFRKGATLAATQPTLARLNTRAGRFAGRPNSDVLVQML